MMRMQPVSNPQWTLGQTGQMRADAGDSWADQADTRVADYDLHGQGKTRATTGGPA